MSRLLPARRACALQPGPGARREDLVAERPLAPRPVRGRAVRLHARLVVLALAAQHTRPLRARGVDRDAAGRFSPPREPPAQVTRTATRRPSGVISSVRAGG